MKKIVIIPILLAVFFNESIAESEPQTLTNQNTQEISQENLKFKKFKTCETLEKTLNEFYKDYTSKYPHLYERGIFIQEWVSSFDSVEESSVSAKSSLETSSDDFSRTNEQVDWVNEQEIIKTDWKYIYYASDYYDQELATNLSWKKTQENTYKKNVFIVKAGTLEIVKKIQLPSHFWWTKLYLKNNKLVIISSWRPQWEFQKQFWDNSTKTYTIIYDVENPKKAKLIKAFLTEWNFSKSRLINNKLYVISNKPAFSLFSSLERDEGIKAKQIVPRWLEIIATVDESKKNVEISWEKKDYNVSSWYVSTCDSIEYILPDNDTNLWYPSFNMISTIDIENTQKESDTKLIFWNLNEIYMSLDNLYITNQVYKSSPFRCPIGTICISPFFYGWTNHTLIHKINITWDKLNYQTSALVEWTPLTQYSMDEYNSDFRILTSTRRWNRNQQDSHTDLYVLDENLKLKSSLQNLGKWEEFKSSRYIADKLFLITFEQIDPLFVIDLKIPEKPKILWELKIPGYSTYLHPYNENHLIWIWYDTKQVKWWGVINSWIKVDLYEIDYNRKPENENNSWDIYVSQKYTKTFWEYWSESEALVNPRIFMRKKDDKNLFIPVTLRKNSPNDIYTTIDFFQGLISINIDDSKWISQNYKITHIDTSSLEENRRKECNSYIEKNNNNEDWQCQQLINWDLYCPRKTYSYIPKYCYKNSTIWEYLSTQSRKYSNDFIKRTLWIGNDIYTISDKKIIKSDIYSGLKKDSTIIK